MNTTFRSLAVLAALALVACGGNPKPKPLPPPPPVAPATPPPAPPPSSGDVVKQEDEYTRLSKMSSDELDRAGLLQEVHFDYDRADIREADRSVLAKNAETLKRFDFMKVTVEGHCDERGTAAYNLALGGKRAAAVKGYLADLGVKADMQTISFGKELPLVKGTGEAAWSQNRRAELKLQGEKRTDGVVVSLR